MADGLDEREKAIFKCYGLKAMQTNKKLFVENEEITAWYIEGFLELENLQNIFSDEQIIDIYDSGL